MVFASLDYQTTPLDFLQLAQHCEMLSDGEKMPRQQEFSLADVPWLYGRLYEVDVLENGRDYYFRAFGIFWQALLGADFTGAWLSELEARTSKLNALRHCYNRVVTTRAPVGGACKLIWPGQAELVFERLLIPFTLDGSTVSQIIVAAHYDADAEDMIFYRGQGLPQMVPLDESPAELRLAS